MSKTNKQNNQQDIDQIILQNQEGLPEDTDILHELINKSPSFFSNMRSVLMCIVGFISGFFQFNAY